MLKTGSARSSDSENFELTVKQNLPTASPAPAPTRAESARRQTDEYSWTDAREQS